MKKIVKRFTVALIVAMMAVIMIPFSATAAEDTYTVYVEVPDTWGTPNIWAWTDGGGNVYDAWPGEPLVEGEDGLYVAELPKTALNFLINYQGDANKTRDIKVTGVDCKVVIGADLSVTVEYLAEEEPTTEEPTTVVQEDTTTKAPTNDTTNANPGLGPETGIIIGAIAVVVLIVVAIIFVVFKKQ